MSLRYEIVFNPVAGKGAALGKMNDIRSHFDTAGLDYDVHITEQPGHAAVLAEQYGSTEDTAVIAAGGDGTCNEVINGLMKVSGRDSGALLGVIPIGRGNDFAFGAGIPGTLKETVALLKEESIGKLDIGKVAGGDYPDGRWFGNGIGVGFDAVVGFEAAEMKHIHGPLAYTLGALKTLALYPAAPLMELTLNGVVSRIEPALISVMNGKRMGGAFYMAPGASTDDGRLNWCYTRQGSRIKLLGAMMAYTKGKQAERDDTFTGHATKISIRALKGSLAVHADGETICRAGDHLDITIEPGALRLIGSRGT